MTKFTFHRVTRFPEFLKMREEWERFTDSYFPETYARTHRWLAAYWKTYHPDGPSAVQVQRDDEGIVAAAPLLVRKENFSGLPVRMLAVLGRGIGREDFLLSPASNGFLPAAFANIEGAGWDVMQLSRVSPEFAAKVEEAATSRGWKAEKRETKDFFITLPADYREYIGSRSKKFRRNLNLAENRMKREGIVEFQVLDPFRDSERVLEAAASIARRSWQYEKGVSHFRDSDSLYANLTCQRNGAGGEDFNLLLVSGIPVAYLLGCRRGRTYYAIDTAFRQDFRSACAGTVLYARIIERLIRERHTDVLDFEGDGSYKDAYATDSRESNSIILYNRRPYSRFIRFFRQSGLYSYMKSKRHGLAGADSGKTTDKEVPDEEASS